MKKVLIFILICIIALFYFLSNSKNTYIPPNDSDNHSTQTVESDEVVTSENWNCTEDCSGHEAGYEWAADIGITDPDDCDGNSNSFIEGCKAYANEQIIERNDISDEDYDYEY